MKEIVCNTIYFKLNNLILINGLKIASKNINIDLIYLLLKKYPPYINEINRIKIQHKQ